MLAGPSIGKRETSLDAKVAKGAKVAKLFACSTSLDAEGAEDAEDAEDCERPLQLQLIGGNSLPDTVARAAG